MNLTRLSAIIRKEFYHIIRDYRSLYLAFAIPLFLIIMFGYALSLDVDHVRTVVVDYDRSPASRAFIEKLSASSYFNLLANLDSTDSVNEWLDRDRASVAVIIAPGFAANIGADREAVVQILIDGSDPVFAGAVRSYLTAFTERYNANLLFNFLNRQGLEAIQPPVDGRIRIWFNEDLESRNFIIPGIIAIIIMIVGAMLTSLVIAREYEEGTMETIKSMPIAAGELLLGKAVPYFFIAFADVLLAMLLGQALFGVVMKGNFWLMLAATSLYLICALCLGLLISTITKSQLMANQGALLFTYLPSMLLSNFVFPIVNMPQVLQWITYAVPARYYIDILVGVYLRDTGLAYLWPSLTVLAGMGAFLAAANYLLLRREGL
ncbi:MAG: ABC transporter permease [Smithellaceae bacterium]